MATTVDKKPAQDAHRKIAGRIMAMLARAEDEAATENEARIAKEKAEKLMSKHSLSREDLTDLDFEYREVMLRFSQQPGWQQEIVAGLKKLLGVFAIYCTGSGRDRKAKYKLTGRASDLDQFEYLLNSITTQVYELCDDWKKDHHNRRQTRDFRMGVAMRVRDRLYDLVTSITERQKEEAEAVAQGSSETFGENETRNEEETGMVFLKKKRFAPSKKRPRTLWETTRAGRPEAPRLTEDLHLPRRAARPAMRFASATALVLLNAQKGFLAIPNERMYK